MGTEEQTENGGGVATADDSLTITDNRTSDSAMRMAKAE